MPKLELFSYWQSSCSWRARIALAWKGIQYEYHPVDLRAAGGGEQQLSKFRKLNPNQCVPVMLVDGHAIAQSGAILEYLEEAYPARPLLPSDLFERAKCVTCPASLAATPSRPRALSPASDKERQALVAAWNKHWIERGLRAVEDELTLCAGRYCVGDEVSLADVYLLPQVHNARICNVVLAEYPAISRVVGELEQLPAFASSRPDKQPDATTTQVANIDAPGSQSRESSSQRHRLRGIRQGRALEFLRAPAGALLAPLLGCIVATEQPSHVPVQSTRGGSASATILRRTSAQTEAAIGAVDPEIAFNVHKPNCFGVCTRNGARLGNEDRFRAIDNLDLYGRGLLEVVPRLMSPFFGDLLKGRVLENFVVEGRAPALKIRNLLKHGRASEDTQFFGVYDGHGGARASSLLALLFPVYILAAPEYKSDLATACHSASMAINDEILKREKDGHCEGGATAVTLLIRGNTFVLSNTGDCRAIMVAKRDKVAQVTQLTTDHKASNDQEKQRIEEHGGLVLYVKGVARVNGRLAVARAFGDAELSQLVIADPEVTVHELHREDEYIVMASDGLWDVLTNEQVASCIRNNPWLNVQEMASMLADRAVELGTMDNVTVVVVDVRGRIS
ncbi:Protein phosphatase 2C family [Phytophthora cactorum]|nr:Protein phosphatase 2C family [Phytophthora cactorum]